MKCLLTMAVLVLLLGGIAGCSSDDDDSSTQAGAESAGGWTGVSTGDTHVVALKGDGTMWTWGGNAQGQLGLDTWADKSLPEQVNNNTWTAMSAGDRHTVAISTRGATYSWGCDVYSQLANPKQLCPKQNVPVMITLESSWKSVSAGRCHTLVLKADGTLWSCGIRKMNDDGTPDMTYMLAEVNTDTDWVAMDAGGCHNVALKADGSLWTWGENGYGQLGIASTMDQDLPCQVGSAPEWSKAFSAGENYTVAVKADGTLWAWGLNSAGQLGDGTFLDRTGPVLVDGTHTWVMVSAGTCHTLAIRSDGTLWVWGCNESGQLGIGTNEGSAVPVQVGTDTNWAMVSAGSDFSVGIRSDGTMWSWGGNNYGQLGNGTNVSSSVPVPVGGQ
jgi:alpha-tubulin suppressor-like RCC1 family protein